MSYCGVPEIPHIFQTSFRPSGWAHARAGIQEDQMLLDARFRAHDGGEATDFFCELLRQNTKRIGSY
jgi:hypothetical protein